MNPPRDYAHMRRDPEVLAAVEECNELLKSSGVAEVCKACWEGKMEKETHGIGCCSRCELSHPSGCLNKPISCAVWLCSYTMKRFPEVAKKLAAIQRRFPIWLSDPMVAFRTDSLDFELSRLLKKESKK